MFKTGSPTAQKLLDALMRFRKLHHHHQPVGGLRQSEFWVLVTLTRGRENKEPGVRVSELARRLDVATPTATQMVIRLEEAGYVERKRSTEDGRIVYVALTQKGSETVENVHRHVVSQFEAVVDFLGKKDSESLAELLNRVTGFLKQNTMMENNE
jgi:DNA-binding MarR family transcriptional regulator